ncbi:hypothetical protein [Stratiformator vulcanicus]|uniref:Uncharacterized protein n=1 Tax=Stratiformator vulcanicus TaxID=2527980 RepID=A0A517QXT2_9PLAN|nr:hypothetical protein [Stratiformator vulcanicus]QDT36417.1 hypothetical protein Pan189_07730 [Stratiformator vulcanicus]
MSFPVVDHAEFEFQIRTAPFKTRRGKIYQVFFFVDAGIVHVARVRGPGQALLDPDKLN